MTLQAKQSLVIRKLPDITFLAEALDDPFTDIRVETLRSHVETQFTHDAIWLNKFDPSIHHSVTAKQFILVEPNGIVITVDVDKVDEHVINDALSLLMEADLSEGYCEFGEAIVYNCDEFLNDTDIN